MSLRGRLGEVALLLWALALVASYLWSLFGRCLLPVLGAA